MKHIVRRFLALCCIPCLFMCAMPSLDNSQATSSDAPQFIFAIEQNEVQIADSFNEVDPSFVVGSLVNIEDGTLSALDNILITDAKLDRTPLTEIVYRDLIENELVASASWLSFLSGKVSRKCRAEVSVIKSAKVTTNSSQIDSAKLQNLTSMILARTGDKNLEVLKKYGIVIGYINYLLSASLYREAGTEVKAGIIAKIEGKYFQKSENLAAQHRIVAVWTPFPVCLASVLEQEMNRKAVAFSSAEMDTYRRIKSLSSEIQINLSDKVFSLKEIR